MTREEAIKKLVNARYADEFQGDEELTTAHLMAIQALSQEPIDCANAEHDADGCLGYSTDRGGYSYCQMCIECPKASINTRDKRQEPCDDAISREELLKAIDTWDKFGCDADTKLVQYQDHYIPYIHYDDVIKCIKGMPSVTQKSGKWIDKQES